MSKTIVLLKQRILHLLYFANIVMLKKLPKKLYTAKRNITEI